MKNFIDVSFHPATRYSVECGILQLNKIVRGRNVAATRQGLSEDEKGTVALANTYMTEELVVCMFNDISTLFA